MLECLIIGDSIAVGMAKAATQCEVIAKIGINSNAWLAANKSRLVAAKKVVVSLGANDYKTLPNQFGVLRAAIDSKNVTWVLPSATLKPFSRAYISEVAKQYGDKTISIKSEWLREDNVHPTTGGYKNLISTIL